MRDAETPAHAHGEGVEVRPRRPREETARLGKEIYERDIRGQVEADHHGEVVAIDVDSRSWQSPTARSQRWTACGRCILVPSMSCVSGSGTGRCAALGQGLCGGLGDPGGRERRL